MECIGGMVVIEWVNGMGLVSTLVVDNIGVEIVVIEILRVLRILDVLWI